MATLQKIFHAVAPVLKGVGKTVDSVGARLESMQAVEKLLPSTRSMVYEGTTPQVESSTFVAPTASVIGDVKIGANSSVWFGAKVRGDVHHIRIGKNVSIGDNSMVHVARIQGDHPTIIGDDVTIGSNAVIHACTIESNSMVGHGAQVLDGAKVESNAVVAPGSMVTPNKTVKSGQLWAGSPAKYLRDLTAEEIASLGATAQEGSAAGQAYAEECSKSFQQVLEEETNHKHMSILNPEFQTPYQDFNVMHDEPSQGSGLIFNSTRSASMQSDKYLPPK